MSTTPGDETDPTIARFLRSHADLKEPTEEVLDRAAAVRQARSQALPAGEPPRPEHGPRFHRAEQRLCDAVESLEQKVATSPPSETEVAHALHAVMTAAARMRAESHSLSLRRTTLSAAGRAALFQALAAFEGAFAELEKRARASHAPRIPWQIELATHVAPGTPVRAMELWGYELPRTPAVRKAWGERCFLSGTPWNVDSHVSPALRYRSLDACSHTLAPKYHALFLRLRRALDQLGGTMARQGLARQGLARQGLARDSLARHSLRHSVERLVRLFPALYEERAAETSSPTFARLGLLDFPSLAVSLNNLLRAFSDRPLFGTRAKGGAGRFLSLGVADRCGVALDGARSGYAWETYDEIRILALRLAFALERLGPKPGDRVAILVSSGCRDFYLVDFAAIFTGLVSVGLPGTMTDEQLRAVLDSTEPHIAVADTPCLARLRDLAARSSASPEVVGMETLLTPEEIPASWSSRSGVSPKTGIVYGDHDGYRTAEEQGIVRDADEDLYSLLYTSGSTGTPKGTIVTRRRWAEEMCFEAGVWPHVSVSFQPSSLAADRGSVWRTLSSGGRVGFVRCGGELFQDVRSLRPTLFDAPPVIWNTLYSEYRNAIEDPSLTPRDAARVRLRFRRALGGRLAFMAVGGAPSDPGVRRSMEEIFGIPMKESYGTTETGNVAADGELLPGLDYRLVDLPELGFTAGDQPYPRGELTVRTPRTTARYWRSDADTRDGFTDDGYFRTGDIVELGPGRRIKLLGRRKQFFKLAGSEFVSPERLERHYQKSARVEAVLVTGSPLRRSVVAVAVPARDGVTEAEILADFRAIATRQGLRAAEVPVGVAVVSRVDGKLPWTAENGLLTPSLKIHRRALEKHYRGEVDAIYARTEPATSFGEPGGDGRERQLREWTRTVRHVAAAILAVEPGEIDVERSFLEHGGDSVAAMELVLRLEQVFAGKGEVEGTRVKEPGALVAVSLEEVAGRLMASSASCAETSRGHVPAALASRRARRQEPRQESGQEPRQETLTTAGGSPQVVDQPTSDEETSLANRDALSVHLPDPPPPPSTRDHVFLTGATGFLGIHLLARLVSDLPPKRRIYALVRASSDDAARRRLTRALRAASLEVFKIGLPGETLPGETQARVIALAGSLADDQLGLTPETYALLATDVGLIYHVAAEVSFGKGYSALREVNVAGTRRVLRLATESTLKAFHLVSSLNVALLLRQVSGSRVYEESHIPDRLSPKVLASQPGYAVSKWVCERMLGELFVYCRGAFRASVSRPALITWSSVTGHANDSDWLPRVLASCLALRRVIGAEEALQLQWVPETPVSARGLDLVPVDFAAHAVSRIGELTRESALPGPIRPSGNPLPTYHVSNIAPAEAGHVTLPHLMDLLAAADLRLDIGGARAMEHVSFAEWVLWAEIESAPAAPILTQLRKMSPAMERTEAGRFAAFVADPRSLLESSPPCDQALVDVYVNRCRYRSGVASSAAGGTLSE